VTRRAHLRRIATLPRRELLETLARAYHRLQNEHKRAAQESGNRRRIEERMLEVRERFDRLLVEWVPDDGDRRAWDEHLHYRRGAPAGPPAIRPLVFRGVSDDGSVVEVRGTQGEELAVEVDGALVVRVAAEKDFASTMPGLTFGLDGVGFHESFEASEAAVDALAEFVEGGSAGPPPWDVAEELLADGLVDARFALTPRGRRALAGR
jgi:hypothetical protein